MPKPILTPPDAPCREADTDEFSTRMFLLSPALARLIERDRAGGWPVRQGYFCRAA